MPSEQNNYNGRGMKPRPDHHVSHWQCAIVVAMLAISSAPILSTGFMLQGRSGRTAASSSSSSSSSSFLLLTNNNARTNTEFDHCDSTTANLRGCSDAPITNQGDAPMMHDNHGYCSQRRNVLSSLLIIMSASPLPLLAVAVAEDGSSSSSSSATVEEPKECQNGGVVSESAVPGAYQQTCMNLEERTFLLESSGDTIAVYQGTNDAGGMAGRTGVAVWNSGILLTRLLDKLNKSNPSIFKNKSILELGCGTALASIAVAKLGASSVIATDANQEVLALAQRNLERNVQNAAADNNNNMRSSNNNNGMMVAKTMALQWGLMDATDYENNADIIIGSDLTYNSGSWVALAETMSTILKPEGIVIYLTLGHSGFNVGGELAGFLSVAENTGLQLLTKDSNEWKENIGSRSIDGLLASAITAEEKSVIDANGGVRVVILGKKKYGRRG
eukprot:CAMPEP_0172305618 /NCGR_PEP_ID=MMETSP1058-20130122/6866_1 /TAXON_ID=83371 /ORGANISM="Detonula confervacea, Strain CCMP 353" /LENGTH=444 /DNA_ID=CAMNT_0013017263 /DNA_START=20 /DNA_END=1354 /DNA_ORIENTATION=+